MFFNVYVAGQKSILMNIFFKEVINQKAQLLNRFIEQNSIE